MSVEYRIEFTIQRQQVGEDDFTDVGFGSSGQWSTVDACAHAIHSMLQNDEWETEPGMPSPKDLTS